MTAPECTSGLNDVLTLFFFIVYFFLKVIYFFNVFCLLTPPPFLVLSGIKKFIDDDIYLSLDLTFVTESIKELDFPGVSSFSSSSKL